MKKRLTPSEKKELSLKRDCRNNYGENDKSSRKSIRKRKAQVNRTYRHKVKQTLSSSINEIDEVTNKVITIKRKYWKKEADLPLKDYLSFKANNSLSKLLYSIDIFSKDDFLSNYEDLSENQIEANKVYNVLEGYRKDSNSTELNFSDQTVKKILETIKKMV